MVAVDGVVVAVVAVEGVVVVTRWWSPWARRSTVVAEPARSVSMAVIELGLGTDAPDGHEGHGDELAVGELDGAGVVDDRGLFEPGGVKLGHTLIWSWPGFPASGVPVGHFSPLVYFGLPGICRVLEVSVELGIARHEAGQGGVVAGVLGWSWGPPGSRRHRRCGSPGWASVDALGLAGRLGWTVPHTSNPRAWYQWAPMAGCTAGAGCWRS